MESLLRIIKCFKPSECKHIRDYYLRKSNESTTKRLQLFDIVKNNFAQGNESACRLIYNREPDSAFCQLKKRLKKDLLNFLILFPTPKNNYSDIKHVNVECRKLYVQAQSLVLRGEIHEATIILKHGLKLSEKYDIIDFRISAMDLLRTISRKDSGDYTKYTKEINKNILLHSTLLKAKAYDHSLRSCSQHAEVCIKSKDSETLASSYLKTKSPNLGFWYYSVKMQEYKLQGDFKMSYLNGLRFLHIIETQPAVSSSINKIHIKNDLARILILSKRNDKAYYHLKGADQLCSECSNEQLMVLDSLFLMQFINSEHKKVEEILNKAFTSSLVKRGNTQWNKWTFYQSCQKFVSGEYESSLSLIRKCENICKENSGLFLEHRLVEMLNLIELKEFDLLEYKIESFRKLIDYNKDLCTMRSRNLVKLIKALIRNNYDFHITSLEEKEIIDAISLGQYDLQITEIIDVNSWFRQKNKAVLELV